jgi:hypothetical protein
MNIIGLYGAFDWNVNQSYDDHQNPTWVHEAGASFNDNGEPIVESPKHAVESFLNLDIDYLVI